MALYKYPRYESGQGWTMKPGNLQGGFWGHPETNIGGEAPNISLYLPQNPPQDSQVSLSTPGPFHTLDIYTEPNDL